MTWKQSRVGAERGSDLAMVLCCGIFLCGAILGIVAAGFIGDTEELYGHVAGYLTQLEEGVEARPALFDTLWTTCRYHLLVVFCGFSLLGALCIPVVCGLRGFYLGFSIAAVMRALGAGGWFVAAGLFGPAAILTLPCFFLLAVQAFGASLALLRAASGGRTLPRPLYGRSYASRCALCAVILLAAVLVELYVTPRLLCLLSAFL